MFCHFIAASWELQVRQKDSTPGVNARCLILFFFPTLVHLSPAWSSRWLGITLASQCQPVSLVRHPIQDLLLATNKHRKWRTKIKHEQFEATIELEIWIPTKIRLNQDTGLHKRTSLPHRGHRPLKCDGIIKHVYFAQSV